MGEDTAEKFLAAEMNGLLSNAVAMDSVVETTEDEEGEESEDIDNDTSLSVCSAAPVAASCGKVQTEDLVDASTAITKQSEAHLPSNWTSKHSETSSKTFLSQMEEAKDETNHALEGVSLLRGDICIDGETEIDDLWVAARIANLEYTRLQQTFKGEIDCIMQPLQRAYKGFSSDEEESEQDYQVEQLIAQEYQSRGPKKILEKSGRVQNAGADCGANITSAMDQNQYAKTNSLLEEKTNEDTIEDADTFEAVSTDALECDGLAFKTVPEGVKFWEEDVLSEGEDLLDEEKPRLSKMEQQVLSSIQKVEVDDMPSAVAENFLIELIGTVYAIVDEMIVVKSTMTNKVLDLGSILCLSSRDILGPISDTFGPVSLPHYVVLLGEKQKHLRGAIKEGVEIFCDTFHSSFIIDRSNISSRQGHGNIQDLKDSLQSDSESGDSDDEDLHGKNVEGDLVKNLNNSKSHTVLPNPVKENYFATGVTTRTPSFNKSTKCDVQAPVYGAGYSSLQRKSKGTSRQSGGTIGECNGSSTKFVDRAKRNTSPTCQGCTHPQAITYAPSTNHVGFCIPPPPPPLLSSNNSLASQPPYMPPLPSYSAVASSQAQYPVQTNLFGFNFLAPYPMKIPPPPPASPFEVLHSSNRHFFMHSNINEGSGLNASTSGVIRHSTAHSSQQRRSRARR